MPQSRSDLHREMEYTFYLSFSNKTAVVIVVSHLKGKQNEIQIQKYKCSTEECDQKEQLDFDMFTDVIQFCIYIHTCHMELCIGFCTGLNTESS